MDVAGEDDVDAGLKEQPLHGPPHGLALPLVRGVGVVPGRVQQRHEPGRGAPVHAGEVPRQPPVLVRAGVEGGVRAQHHDVHGAGGGVEGVVEVGRRPALLVRRRPPRAVRGERGRRARDRRQRRCLHLVVALRDHPRPPARVPLHKPPERVPQRLLRVGVRQVARHQQHVVVRLADVRQRRRRPFGLAQVACSVFQAVRSEVSAPVNTASALPFRTYEGELDGQRGRRRPEAELFPGHAAPVVVHRAGLQGSDLDVVDLAGGVEEVAVRGVVAGRRRRVVPGGPAVLHHGLGALVVGDPRHPHVLRPDGRYVDLLARTPAIVIRHSKLAIGVCLRA
jgi:hypothetical protein